MHKLYDHKVDTSDENCKEGNQLLDKTNYTIRDIIDSPTKKISRNGLLASKSLSSLKEKWFIENEFPTGIPVSKIKYNHLGLKHQNNSYLFNDQRNYALAPYFVKAEMIKGNINKFLSDLLITLLIKKLSYKNVDEWMKKLLEILWSMLENKEIEHKYNVESGGSGIVWQEIAIQLQNILNYIKFLMGHLSFQHNQTYEPSHIYNQNKDRVYNEMHIRDW